ncbi:hypothetical protein BDN67DRAFT_978576 [Paxillus ammoniavirescens]|nr:hypothetical protein BDN67DRAFT_978576 [Paxillus ammoniavirescens]
MNATCTRTEASIWLELEVSVAQPSSAQCTFTSRCNYGLCQHGSSSSIGFSWFGTWAYGGGPCNHEKRVLPMMSAMSDVRVGRVRVGVYNASRSVVGNIEPPIVVHPTFATSFKFTVESSTGRAVHMDTPTQGAQVSTSTHGQDPTCPTTVTNEIQFHEFMLFLLLKATATPPYPSQAHLQLRLHRARLDDSGSQSVLQ